MNGEAKDTEAIECPHCMEFLPFNIVETHGRFGAEPYTNTKAICPKCGTYHTQSSHWKNGGHWVVGNCSICGRNAAYNTPTLRSDNGDIVCNNCAGRKYPEDVVLIAIDQHFDEREYKIESKYYLNGNVIWWKPETDTPGSMWTHGGSHAFSLREEEKGMGLLEIFDLMQTVVGDDPPRYRCTRCNLDFKGEPAGYPLFAGVNCLNCWEKHLAFQEEERKKGNVCRMCGKPYSACYC